jgi:hypothetical protein
MVSIIPYPYDLYGIFRFYRADYLLRKEKGEGEG